MDKRLITGILALPIASLLTAAVWALDSRYITHETFRTYEQQQYVRTLGDRIDELTVKESLGMATDYDKAILKQIKEKLERTR
jgi:ribosome assembly protein YihI (activator of Der GTPase)